MVIDDYVTDLGRALSGPPGPKRDLVVEARDSLADAADALQAAGLDRLEAERLAVHEFGEVAEVAPGYQRELTATAGRWLATLIFLSVPVTVLMWSALWHFYPVASDTWAARPDWYSTVSLLLDLTQLGIGVYGGLALFALGRGNRWIGGPRLVTRSLGIVVLVALPVTGGLGLLLTLGPSVPHSVGDFAPLALANLLTSASWALQLYGAARCVRLTRPA
ncbi:permease prefix domain 1-containing protein [Nonomuraea sp. NPDC048916]|uniref:permease prefix domain 1-containing protein n=1 Tax=Nonomuraea sp. NPDC048916 TaxID=3154232 RepID=UPI0033C3B587